MICIVLCMICPIFGKPNSPKSQGFKEISKENTIPIQYIPIGM